MTGTGALLQRGMQMRSRCRMFSLVLLLLLAGAAADPAGTSAAEEAARKIRLQSGSAQPAVLTVEVVSDAKKRQRGLAQRPPIPEDAGMLFLLEDNSAQFFWMKGMEFPLDILFFDKDRKLLEILPDLTPCEQCPKYKAPANTAYVLEINAGLAGDLGLKEGDSFVFENK